MYTCDGFCFHAPGTNYDTFPTLSLIVRLLLLMLWSWSAGRRHRINLAAKMRENFFEAAGDEQQESCIHRDLRELSLEQRLKKEHLSHCTALHHKTRNMPEQRNRCFQASEHFNEICDATNRFCFKKINKLGEKLFSFINFESFGYF